MKTKTIVFVACLALASCSSGHDCRHKTHECAEGFECEQAGSSKAWECVKIKESAEPATPQPEAEPEHTAAPVPPAPQGPTLCPKHPMCSKNALECVCDERGRLQSRALDTNGDGKPDEKASYRNDEHGRPRVVLVDEGIDGSANKRHDYTYDQRGNPLTWEIRTLTDGRNSEEQSRLVYIYDKQGNLVAEELDIGIDGKIDKRCTYSPSCQPPIPNPNCKKKCN